MIFYEHFFFYRGIKYLSGLSSLSTSWYWGVGNSNFLFLIQSLIPASWSSRCKRPVIFLACGEGWRFFSFFFFFLGGGGWEVGGSHGFQGEQRKDQSLPTECKGETMKKLTAKTLPMGEGKNIEGPLGGNQINFFVTQTKSYKPPPPPWRVK